MVCYTFEGWYVFYTPYNAVPHYHVLSIGISEKYLQSLIITSFRETDDDV